MESWRVKVHPRLPVVYLWGGDQVDAPTDAALVLTFRVDDFGYPITFGRRDNSSNPIGTLGTLKPGESFSIELQQLRGVWAKCVDPQVHTYVYCCLSRPALK